jgi:hypothetical protein
VKRALSLELDGFHRGELTGNEWTCQGELLRHGKIVMAWRDWGKWQWPR